jgi:hypothetical protein
MSPRRLGSHPALLGLALLGACSGASTPADRVPGAEQFLSQPPGAGARSGDVGGVATTGGNATPTAVGATATGAPRAVEEADVYRLSGSTLYVLNGLRGLQVVDLADLDRPRLLGKVPVVGQPVDLYLRGTTAVFAVSDALAWGWVADGDVARPRTGSQVWTVDVADPAAPRVLSRLDVDGFVEQTRFVGDVLYVFSRRWGWYDALLPTTAVAIGPAPGGDSVFLQSFDFSVPAAPRSVARVDFGATGWSTHVAVTADRIVLSQSGWSATSGAPATTFRTFDISSPAGAIAAGAAFEAPGQVQDRWGLDLDAASGTFRAVLARTWNTGADLRIWATPTPATATALGAAPIDVAESLTAARFDGARAYVVTAARIDPLWVVDLADPAHPALLGQVIMPGQLDFVEPRGDRLVALGHVSEPGTPWQLAVSLFDVADPRAPALVSRVTFGSGYGWVSAAPDDLRKAFQVLDASGLVLVPFQGWDPGSWSWVGGVQLIDLGAGGLTLRGVLDHPGQVARAFPVGPAAPGGSQFAALSDQRLQLFDATDRDAPRERSGLDLARSVWSLGAVRGKLVALTGDWWRGDTSLVVTDPADPDAPVPLARLKAPAPASRMFVAGDIVWLLSTDATANGGGRAWLSGWDLTDPLNPLARGQLDVTAEIGLPGLGWSWGWGDQVVCNGRVLAVHRMRGWGPLPLVGAPGGSGSASDDQVLVYDLTDPDRPHLGGRVILPSSAWSWGLTASGDRLYLTHFVPADRGDGAGRYLLDRIDVADPHAPALLAPVNIPGTFLAAAADGVRVYALESGWTPDQTWTWLHALDLTGRGTARLAGSVRLAGYAGGALVTPDAAYVATWDWTGSRSVLRLAGVALAPFQLATSQAVEASWAWPLSAGDGWLFLGAGGAGGQGVLAYRLGLPGHPTFTSFTRTSGWALDALVLDGVAYLPSGDRGVEVVVP